MIQGRSQGRIFFGPVKVEITKIGQVFLVWQPLGVSLPLFRLRAPVPELSWNYWKSQLLGWYVANGSESGEYSNGEGLVDYSIAKLTLWDKSPEISSRSGKANEISWSVHKYRENKSLPVRKNCRCDNSVRRSFAHPKLLFLISASKLGTLSREAVS